MSSFTGNASDNLVVGSGSGGEGITVYSGTNNQGSLTFADGTSGDAAYRGAVEYNHTNDRLAFRTAGTGNRMVLDSSGRLLVGTTSASSTATTLLLQGSPDGASGPSYLRLATGTATPSSTGTIGQISFTDSGHSTAASIIAFRDSGSWSSSSKPTKLTFSTTANGASTATARMVIDSSGNVAIGSTTAPDKLNVGSTSNGFTAIRILTSDTGNGEVRFGDASNGSAGYIRYAHNGNHLIFARDGVEAMRISSGGNVGIGDTSPSHKLVVKDAGATNTSNYLNVISGNAANAGIAFGDTDSDLVGGVLYNHTDNALRFFQSGFTEAARIDSSGFVGINEASPQHNGGGQLTVKRSSTATTGLNGVLRLKQGSATNGNRASLVFSSLDNFNVAAVNGVIETHAGSESNNVGRLEFYTKASGSSIAERMRITSAGKIQITGTRGGTLQSSDNDSLELYTSATSGNASTGGGITFYNHHGNGHVMGGVIHVVKANGVYENSSSDMLFGTRIQGSSVAYRARLTSVGDWQTFSSNVNIDIANSQSSGNTKRLSTPVTAPLILALELFLLGFTPTAMSKTLITPMDQFQIKI